MWVLRPEPASVLQVRLDMISSTVIEKADAVFAKPTYHEALKCSKLCRNELLLSRGRSATASVVPGCEHFCQS